MLIYVTNYKIDSRDIVSTLNVLAKLLNPL